MDGTNKIHYSLLRRGVNKCPLYEQCHAPVVAPNAHVWAGRMLQGKHIWHYPLYPIFWWYSELPLIGSSQCHLFNSHDPRCHVGYCDHFTSVVVVVCEFFHISILSDTTVQLEPNLVKNFIGWSSPTFILFPIRNPQQKQETPNCE